MPAAIQVDGVEIDEASFEIRSNGAPLNVQPRVFDFVVCLARNRGRVVTKAELVERVWGGIHVTDAALARCACIARKALGDPTLIVTVHRRGYRWA